MIIQAKIVQGQNYISSGPYFLDCNKMFYIKDGKDKTKINYFDLQSYIPTLKASSIKNINKMAVSH